MLSSITTSSLKAQSWDVRNDLAKISTERQRARKRLELYHQREAQVNQKREEAVKKRIKTLADYEKLCKQSSKMWQDYLLSIKNVKHSTDAKKEC